MAGMSTHTAGVEVPVDTLAVRLVIARVHAGHYNAAAAARAVGVTRQSWSNWERGEGMRHAEMVLPHIAERLGVDPHWLRYGGPLGSGDPDGGIPVDRRPRQDSNLQPTDWADLLVMDLPRLAVVA